MLNKKGDINGLSFTSLRKFNGELLAKLQLNKLTELAIWDTDFSTLTFIAHFEKLKKLICGNLRINNLAGIEGLTQLTRLDCSDTRIWRLSGIEGLIQLEVINAERCRINKLSRELTALKLTIDINVGHDIFDESPDIYLKDNPLYFPPPEIIIRGNEVIDYYFDSLQGKTRQLNEAKVILIGDGAAGKTSLIERFMHDKFNPNQNKTEGIAINQWIVDADYEEIKIHCWDFGGQEIMRATHQLFLSERCVYLVILDGRKDEKPEQWLKQVMAVTKNSPIFMISNKIDEHYDNNLTEQQLRKKYPQIIGFYHTSCKDGRELIS